MKIDSTLSKGILILEALSSSPQDKGVTELSDELGLTKSNVFRLLQTLSNLGYVKQKDGKKYSATLRAWRVGRNVINNLNLREIVAPEMHELWSITREVIYLAVTEDLSVIYIDKVEGPNSSHSWNPIGGIAPIHCVGTGKAILAANYDTMRDLVVGRLTRHTERTITDVFDLDADVATTQKQGYAVDYGEFRAHVYSFGAPIFVPGEKAIAALGISVFESHLSEGSVEHFGALVRDAAERVIEKLAAS